MVEPLRDPLRHRIVEFLLRLAIQLPTFVMLYVLSIGPMFWYWYSATYLNGSKFIAKLYYPLLWACKNDYIRYWVNRYIDWWIS